MSSLREYIVTCFKNKVKEMPGVPLELRSQLEKHPRMSGFMDKLTEEFSTRKGQKYATRENIKTTVESMTENWVNLLMQLYKENNMSHLAKAAVRNAENKKHYRQTVIDKAVDTGIIDEEVISVITEKD